MTTLAAAVRTGWDAPQDASPVDPTSLRPLGDVPATTPKELDALASAADRCVRGSWSTDTRLRQDRLWRWAEVLAERTGELVEALVRETGKNRREAHAEVAGACEALRYNAGMARLVGGRAGTLTDGSQAHLVREPVGVTGFIVPWNWPLLLLMRDLAPALAAGVTALIKPAPQTTRVTLQALELGYEAGLPRDVVAVAVGDVAVGEAVVTHPLVRAVAFTGSTRVGGAIRQAASADMTRTLLELGGKASMLVFDDADVDTAAETAARASVITTGQMCMACTRLLVHRSVFDRVRERVVDTIGSLRVGDPAEERSDVGPLISAASVDGFVSAMELAQSSATVLVGGKRLTPDGLPGHFVSPAVVTDVDLDSPLVQDDLFAPVLTLEPFDSETQAVRMANATPYGLVGSVWTSDVDRSWRTARALRCGTVWINGYNRSYPEMPSGGYGASGLGRTRGVEGIEQFTELKHVHFGVRSGEGDPR